MESVLYLILLMVLIVVCIKQGLSQNSPMVLSSLKAAVLENSSVALTCSNTTGTVASSFWKTSLYDNQLAYCYRFENSCVKTSFLRNITFFDCICNDNGSYTVLLKHVDRYQHGSAWTCGNHFEQSNTVVINVSVPVTNVVLIQSGNKPLYENTSVTCTCTSSYSLPSAQIHWYRSYRSSTMEITDSQDVDIKRKTHTREDNVIRLTETLSFRVNRSVNGWIVYCTATNWHNSIIMSDKIELSVIYPPDLPPMLDGFINGSTYRIIENDKTSLSCSIKGGNPLAKPELHCKRIDNIVLKEHIINNETVTSYLSWTAKRTDGKTCTCQTGHVLSNVSTYINIDIFYAPEIPSIQLHYLAVRKNVTSDTKLVEHRSYRLLCSADANPPPSEYIWDGPQTTGIAFTSSFDFHDVKRTQNGTYTCHARNIMRPTSGDSRTMNNNNTVNVDILFKPTLADISRQDVAEGSILNITCEVISSNPSQTYFTWTRDTGDFYRNSTVLVLQNVSRRDAMNYTCTVKNYMKPTVGEDEEGYANETFYLNVWYRASVAKFVVNGYEQDVHIMTNESTTISLTCEIESNPASTVKIITPNGMEIISTGTNVFSYSHYLSSCVDNGTYTCSGSNDYNNGQPGIAQLAVFVKCTPMAYQHIAEDIRSKLYAPVTLKFRALAFPEPEFTWEKWTNSSWHKITNGNIFSISSFDLQSNLTVINFTTTTPRVYRLIVENEIGRLIQNYTLKLFDYSGEKQGENSTPVPGIVLGVLSVLVLTIAVVVFICLRRRYQKNRGIDNKERSYENLPEMRTMSEGQDPAIHEPVYEGLRPDAERRVNEKNEQAYEILQPELGLDGAMNPTYTNLKL